MDTKSFVHNDIFFPKSAWDSLSLSEKSEMMRVAVRNGITDLKTIREKYNEFAEGGNTKQEPTYNGGTLDEVTVTGYRPIELKTYYPLGKDYPWTGHSQLNIPITKEVADEYGLYGLEAVPLSERKQMWITVDKKPRDRGYNLFTNNCADATLNYLNTAFDTKESPILFTTPGDVRDYAIDTLKGKKVKDRNGVETILIHRNKGNADTISRRVLDLQNAQEFMDKGYTGAHLLMRANGGSIHIKPENRGKFTALKERTGHSATWFKEHGTPAQKKMATFDLNSRHWKHGLGGNLFGEAGQMQIGRNYWQSQAQEPTFMESLAEFNRQQEIKKQQQRETLRRKINTVGRKLAEERMRESQTESNDNAWVETPLTYRKKNLHLTRRAEEGAKAYATWEKEHPNLTAWGNLLGAAPFAVAAYPFAAAAGAGVTALGDAAATTVGQGITNFLAPIATTTVAGATVPQWVNLGLTSVFGAHGIQTAVDEEGISPMTALEVAPILQVAKPAAQSIFNKVRPAVERAEAGRTPVITAENAASMTPEQWTAAQDAAIARGDMTEAQRLRDLHFKVSAPNTKIVDENGNDESLYGTTDGGMYGTGVYTTPYKGYAEQYGDNMIDLYANISNPVDARNLSIDDLMLGKLEEGNNIFRWTDIGGKRDGVLGKNHYLNTKYPYEVVSHNPSKVKSADAVTYDNNGTRIPLGERDNFSINDIRYGWPWGKEPKGTLVEDFTDFNAMVERMNSAVEYAGKNPFKDGKMTGFRKWALDNGAAPEKILEIENKYSKDGWKALKKYEKADADASGGGKGFVQMSKDVSNFNQIFPHEVEHRLLAELFGEERASISAEEATKAFKEDIWRIPKGDGSGEMYYQERNFEELLPRFTQIKNALGIKEFRALTESELRKAYQLFKQGDKRFASNLKEFFENIKDWRAAAKLSGKALSGTGIGTIAYKSLGNGEEVQDYR